jgi:hypothetical protein
MSVPEDVVVLVAGVALIKSQSDVSVTPGLVDEAQLYRIMPRHCYELP